MRQVLARYRHPTTTRSPFGPGVHLLNTHTVKASPWFPALQSAAIMTDQQLTNHINALYPEDEEEE